MRGNGSPDQEGVGKFFMIQDCCNGERGVVGFPEEDATGIGTTWLEQRPATRTREEGIMQNCGKNGSCGSGGTFSWGEKLFVVGTFYGFIAVGAWGIWPASPGAALAYVAYALVSFFLLMRYTVCARCPHLFEENDCVFVPVPLVKTFVKPRQGPLKWWEYLIVLCAPGGTVLIPLYWLIHAPLTLIVYLILAVTCIGTLKRRICTKCRVEVCPMNSNRMFRA